MTRRRRFICALLALGVIAGSAGTALAPAALACGGFFCQNAPMNQAGERILFVQDGEDVVAHVQIQYQGAADQFSWVVPVPSEPKLGVGNDQVFSMLTSVTQPQFQLDMKTEGECKQNVNFSPIAAGAPMAAERSAGVSVVAQDQVGPYDTAILQSNDPQALKTWLRENEYDIPQTLDPLLDPYVTGQYYFVALKLQQDRQTGDLQPIVLRYKATKPGIPIRLTGVAATEDMDVYVWVLGGQRAIPENYKHAQINEARIDWLNAGSNYRQVVTEAMNEAGGQAFVTDYAGDSKVFPLDQFDPSRFDLARLEALTDPFEFARAIMDQGYFARGSAQAMSFLQRHVPKPEGAKAMSDRDFYNELMGFGFRGTGTAEAALDAAQFQVDTAKAVAELKETVVVPNQQIRDLFAEHPYLTRLYTTLSPKEMTQDPTFLFNPDLPKVSNIHRATGVIECSPSVTSLEAPVKITLANGISFYATRRSNFGNPTPVEGEAVTMPAAARIEQLKTSGEPALIKDNQAAIKKAVSTITDQGGAIAVSSNAGANGGAGTSTTVRVPRTRPQWASPGFGCTSCAATNTAPVPVSQGLAEGATYGLILLGFLGYRRWARKR